MPTVQLRTRLDRDLKLKGDAVLKAIGLDASTFVAMSMAQLVNRRGLPFGGDGSGCRLLRGGIWGDSCASRPSWP